jgi:hypothetical protein
MSPADTERRTVSGEAKKDLMNKFGALQRVIGPLSL